MVCNGKGKAIPMPAFYWHKSFQEVEAPRVSRPSAHESDKVISPKHGPPLLSRRYPWYSYLLGVKSTPVSEGLGQRKSPNESIWMNQNRAVPQPTLSPHTRDLEGNAVCVVHEVSLEEGFLLVFLSFPVSINPANASNSIIF